MTMSFQAQMAATPNRLRMALLMSAASGIAFDLVGANPAQGPGLLLPLAVTATPAPPPPPSGLEGHRRKGGTGRRELNLEPVGRLVAHRTELGLTTREGDR